MSRLSESVSRALHILHTADLAADYPVAELLAETAARRALDLSDLTPREQAALVAGRSATLIPSADALAERIAEARDAGRPLIVKFGIDPTSPDVHLGHTVPIVLAARLQRMGHRVVFIIGDITARIGDPSGRSSERPPLSDEDIAANLATYRRQVAPFIDVERAELRFNSEWLSRVTLPELVGVLARVPVSMSLQREDFRTRLAAGHGLSMAEFVYAVAMAWDSVAVEADVELGGVDQLLNLQMCRRVMDVTARRPEVVVTTPLIAGTDGSGAKMSKSRGNYVALTATRDEVFGRVMSIPDALTEPYLRALTEWTDEEVAAVGARLGAGTAHPMDVKRLLAGEVVAALHGTGAAAEARAGFAARFSRRAFGDVRDLPVASLDEHGGARLGAVVAGALGFAPSVSAVRRIARQNGLRVVREVDGEQVVTVLAEESVGRTLGEAVGGSGSLRGAEQFLKVGRRVARIVE